MVNGGQEHPLNPIDTLKRGSLYFFLAVFRKDFQKISGYYYIV